jgi:broad specificity phosphatase PhoE
MIGINFAQILAFILEVKKIYLIRHGQTDFNLRGIVQGSGVDSDLNDFGRQQSEAFFKTYRHIEFDKIYTSNLKRSVQSVQNFIDLGIPFERLEGLNEISWGNREGQAITREEDAYYHNMLSLWRQGETHHKIEFGESPEDVVFRQKKSFNHIMAKENESCILICMHGRAIRILLTHLLNYPLKEMDVFEHANLCLYELVHTGTLFQIVNFNDVSHLKSLKVKELS